MAPERLLVITVLFGGKCALAEVFSFLNDGLFVKMRDFHAKI